MVSYDIRLTTNFKMFVCGPSRCGKTLFVSKLIQNMSTFTKSPPQKIIYVYKVWQSIFDELQNNNIVFIKEQDDLTEKLRDVSFGESSLIIFDDLINSKCLEDIANLFVVDGRHSNYSMIYLSQRMFVNNDYFRQISNNCDYLVIFRNPRNYSEIRILAQQITPINLDLIQIYSKACKSPFSYLFINLTQECDERVKYLSHIFDSDNYLKCYIDSKESII